MLSVRVGELDIAYRETGSGDPVFLLNGTGESSFTWRSLMETLARRHRCVAVDARDTGSSSYTTLAYSPADLARDAAGVIAQLELGPCHVVGFSLGGAVAQELAIADPGLVRTLILLSTWARSDAWFVSQMRLWQALRRAIPDEERFLDALEPWLLAPRTFDDAALRARIRAMWDADEPDQHPDGWIRQCEADIAHDAADRLREVLAPALVIVGEDDICTPLRYARELTSLLPNAEVVTIADAGHCALFERPDDVSTAILDFLGRHRSG